MENNEIMNESMDMVNEFVGDDTAGIGAGAGVFIGVGLTLAVLAGVKLIKKACDAHKAKKELRQADEEDYVEDVEDDEAE